MTPATKPGWKTLFFQVNFAVAMFLMIWVAEMISAGKPDEFSNSYWGFAGFSLYSVASGFYMRKHLQRQIIVSLDEDALKKTFLRNLFSMSSAATVCFMGAFSRMFLGTPLLLCLPFYVAGFLLLIA